MGAGNGGWKACPSAPDHPDNIPDEVMRSFLSPGIVLGLCFLLYFLVKVLKILGVTKILSIFVMFETRRYETETDIQGRRSDEHHLEEG